MHHTCANCGTDNCLERYGKGVRCKVCKSISGRNTTAPSPAQIRQATAEILRNRGIPNES